LWQWNPKINNWEHPTTLSVGRGYYVYASSDCSVPLQGSQYSFDSLTVYKDWNMIAGMNENLDSVKGNCIINDYKGHKVWYWNPRINNWEHPTYLELGKGYYVYVNGDCTLSKSGPPIP